MVVGRTMSGLMIAVVVAAFDSFAATAQGQTTFNPGVANTFTNVGGFDASANTPAFDQFNRVFVIFDFRGNPVSASTFTISNISITGDGIEAFFTFPDVSVSANAQYVSSQQSLDFEVQNLNFLNSRISFSLPAGPIAENTQFTAGIRYRDESGSQVSTDTIAFVAAPEPSTWVMATVGLACAAWTATRRRRRS